MENRKFIILFLLLSGLILSNQAFAYEVGTHAFLTKEAIQFYKQHFENKIPAEFEDEIIEGSIREDDSIRWMNHFYDPVYNRGLTLSGNWLSAKDWARSGDYQISALYNPIMRTTVADFLAFADPDALRGTDFTWERAIEDYLRGKTSRAFRGLGQILHLIEDVSVPDHTRNDPHPAFNHKDTLETGSPYELWTSNFNLRNPDNDLNTRLQGRKPIILESLNYYFDSLATYSNKNFYSKDTIGSEEYKEPRPDYFESDGLYIYGFNKDPEFGDFHLIAYQVFLDKYSWVINNKDNLILEERIGQFKILPDYWSRLSVKAVQHGAGVIDFFFKEVEKAKNDPKFLKEEKAPVAQLINNVKDFFQAVVFGNQNQSENLKLVAQISLSSKDAEPAGTLRRTEIELETDRNNDPNKIKPVVLIDEEDEDAKERTINAIKANNLENKPAAVTAADLPSVLPTVAASAAGALPAGGIGQGEATFPQCKYDEANGLPTRQKLLINEVAWMGGPDSANDEWLELKNISGAELDISGWQLLDKKEQIKITFSNGTKMAADSYWILERTDDDSMPGLTADFIYTGALSNTDEGLRLFDNQCNLIDEVLADTDWPAGDSAARKTMERGNDLSWHTSLFVMGTPKASNSSPQASIDETQNNADDLQQTTDDNQTTNDNEQNINQETTTNHIVISEVQITGGPGKTTNDFIELYNPTDSVFNLNGHRLVKRTKIGDSDTSIKSWTSDAFIPAKGFYLWANSDYTDIAVSPDVTTTASIANDNGIALRFGPADIGEIIDSVAWGEAENIFVEGIKFENNPDANQSLERKALKDGNCVSTGSGQSGEFLGHTCDTNNNSTDFELRPNASPQNSQSFPEPRSAPISINNFNAEYNPLTLGISFNWDESADYSGATSSVQYILNYATSSETTPVLLTEAAATTTYYFATNEVGTNYSFSIIAKDAEGLTSSSTSRELSAPSFLTNLYWYSDPRNASSTAVELRYDAYPFIPDLYARGNAWKVVVLYPNQEAPAIPYFESGIQYEATADGEVPKYGQWGSEISEALRFKYPNCAGSFSTMTAIILPDAKERCSADHGGIRNSSLRWNQLEDLILILNQPSDQPAPASGDYLTAAFYAYSGNNTQTLVAVDHQKYFFQDSVPAHQSPELSGSLEIEFNSKKSQLEIEWQAATDSDTLDSLITYEINYATTTEFLETEWQSVGGSTDTERIVSPGDNFLIGVRAKDDFKNASSVETTSWAYPETVYLISQDQANGWSGSFGTKNPNCTTACPGTASLQSIRPAEDWQLNLITLRLKQEVKSDKADLLIGVYPDKDGLPDFDLLIGEAKLKDLFNPEADADISFTFDDLISLSADTNYWLVLSVQKYSDSRGYRRNEWQNAIYSGEDTYVGGEAGKGVSDACDNKTYCKFTVPYPDETADWYFKIGLKP